MRIQYSTSQIEFYKEYIDSFLKSKDEELNLTIMHETEALYGNETSINKQWCDENNVPYLQKPLFQNVGCIVASEGNVLIDLKEKAIDGQCISDKFAKDLMEYFKSKGLDSVRQDNNDVLIDDFKVASGAEVTLPTGLQYMVYQININQDLEVIKHACTKPMIKIPKALSEYGITTKEMSEFCINYWK